MPYAQLRLQKNINAFVSTGQWKRFERSWSNSSEMQFFESSAAPTASCPDSCKDDFTAHEIPGKAGKVIKYFDGTFLR